MAEPETVVIYNIRLDRLETVRANIGQLLTKNNPTTWRMARPADLQPKEAQPQDGAEAALEPVAAVEPVAAEEPPKKRKRRKRRTKAQIAADKAAAEQKKLDEQSYS